MLALVGGAGPRLVPAQRASCERSRSEREGVGGYSVRGRSAVDEKERGRWHGPMEINGLAVVTVEGGGGCAADKLLAGAGWKKVDANKGDRVGLGLGPARKALLSRRGQSKTKVAVTK